ncbi:chorismate mutase [Arthrobacter sp. CJ23]|uniref:chorismate mutase n=1 Tax=Arthrobacter sp. CJ23 TaxID=2972479 RepID=UPI00215CE5D4|nr:chorismate mutase [Arthrobacter sp. CJ23]UVJ39744.1 chorismate mutase [Arthrobacter sp. CJ23]
MTRVGIEDVRTEIDALDRQIVELLCRRQHWVVEAGKLKSDPGAVRAPDRVEQVISKVRALAVELGAAPDVVERTYRAMIAAFIDLELTIHENHRDSASATQSNAV